MASKHQPVKAGQKIATIDMMGRPIKYYWIESVDSKGRVVLSDKPPS